MRIRTQFIVTMIIFGIVLLIVAASVALTSRQLMRLDEQEEIAISIEREASELGYLSNDYLLYREDQQQTRWQIKWSSMSRDLDRLEPNSPEQQVIIDNIKANHQRLKAVFDNVASAFQDTTQTPAAESVQSFTQVSWSRMAVQNQGIAFDALQLSQVIRDRRDQVKQTNSLLIISLLGAFIAYFITNYLIVQRRLFKSIADLHSGTKVVGSGNLDFALEVKRNDEIGELSRAFNRMTADLKGVTASKAELEREVAERKAAELALYTERERLAVTLGSIGDGVIATDVEANVVLLNGVAEELTGWTHEEAAGKPLREVFNIINEITGEPAEDPVDKALKTGVIVGLANHTALIAKDGTKISIADSCAPIRALDGSVIGAVLVFRDVTEQKKAEELRDALNEINAAINSTLDFDEIVQRVLIEGANAIGSETSAIVLREEDHWFIKYINNLPLELHGMRLTKEQGKHLEYVASTKEVLVIEDTSTDERVNREFIQEIVGVQSALVLPLLVKGEVIGALPFTYRSTKGVFDEAQIDFANKLAASISLALENARLFELEVEARRQAGSELELSNLLLKATDTLAESIDLNRVLESLADIVLDVTGRRRIGIYLLDKKTGYLEAKAGRGESAIPVGSKFSLKQLAPQFQSVVYDKQSRVIDYESPDIQEENRQRAKAMNIKVSLSVPLLYKGNVLGVLALDNPGERQNITQRDLDLVEGIAAQAAVAIENARLYEAERHIADILQEALLTVPDIIHGIEYGRLYRSATEGTKIGGDFYDLFELEDGRVGITLGDVSGKGLKAASLTAVVRNTIRAYALDGHSPSEIMAKTNDVVRLAAGQSSFITVFLGVLDTTTGKLTYCSAGHPPAMIRRVPDIELLREHSPIIGAFADMSYTEEETYLQKGDCLVLYTDGITEARCVGEFYCEDRLIDFLTKTKQVSTKDIPRAIYNDVVDYSGDKLLDDVAILAVSLTDEVHA